MRQTDSVQQCVEFLTTDTPTQAEHPPSSSPSPTSPTNPVPAPLTPTDSLDDGKLTAFFGNFGLTVVDSILLGDSGAMVTEEGFPPEEKSQFNNGISLTTSPSRQTTSPTSNRAGNDCLLSSVFHPSEEEDRREDVSLYFPMPHHHHRLVRTPSFRSRAHHAHHHAHHAHHGHTDKRLPQRRRELAQRFQSLLNSIQDDSQFDKLEAALSSFEQEGSAAPMKRLRTT